MGNDGSRALEGSPEVVIGYYDLVQALRGLDLDRRVPVIAHSSLSVFGEIQGGAPSMLGALLTCFNTLVMPAFNYKTMVIPETGPPDNGIRYGSGRGLNRMAEIFRMDLPADRLMGVVAEALRNNPAARRSCHPILSFVGVNAESILSSQTMQEPLAPIMRLYEAGGWVLLLGVDHTVNTSIHLGEQLAGRRQFTRWALTTKGAVECPGFPGCSQGFHDLEVLLGGATRRARLGPALIQAVPLTELLPVVTRWVQEDPEALLCDRVDCELCQAVRGCAAPSFESHIAMLTARG